MHITPQNIVNRCTILSIIFFISSFVIIPSNSYDIYKINIVSFESSDTIHSSIKK